MTRNKPMMVAAVLLATVACALAVTWGPPQQVTTGDYTPYRVAMNNAWGVQAYENDGSNDLVYVVFWCDSADCRDVRYARSTNNGANWTEPYNVSDPDDDNEAYQPALAVYGDVWNNHELGVAWYDDDDDLSSILSRRNDSCGESDGSHWKTDVHRSGYSEEWDEECAHPSHATSAAANDRYYSHVVWDDWHDDLEGSVIWYDNKIYSPDDGQTYGMYSDQVTEWDGYSDISPSIAATWVTEGPAAAAHLYVAYYGCYSGDPSHDEIWVTYSANAGSDWSNPVNISNTYGFDSQVPSIAISGSNIYIAWQEENQYDHRFRIYFRRSTNMGASWEDAQAIPDEVVNIVEFRNTAPECFTPSIACYGDYVYLMFQAGWGDSITPGYGNFLVASSSNGQAWSGLPCEGYTDDEPDLDEGDEGLFPTISVSHGTHEYPHPPFLSVVYSGYDENDEYRVTYVRGDDITTMPRGVQGQGGSLAQRVQLAVLPTIVRSSARIRATLGEPGPYRVAIYDACGQLVRTLFGSSPGTCTRELAWDGTDEYGRRVAAGTYLLLLRAGSGMATRSIRVLARK